MDQVEASHEVGAHAIELHTGTYADAPEGAPRLRELEALRHAGRRAVELGLTLHAGHGLNLENVREVARIPRLDDLNIGHSIVSRAVFLGMERAVREMKDAIDRASGRPL
jgi:pyridoxine 5-phosphate synthase